MIDLAGITQRGAERSAPRSRSGGSAANSKRVSRSWAHLVATHATEEAPFSLHRNPPDARPEVELRLAIAEDRALDLLSPSACCAIESGTQPPDRAGSRPSRLGCLIAQLGAQGGSTPTGAIARATSARGERNATHERVVLSRVGRRPSVRRCQSAGIPVEHVTLVLERTIQ